MQNTKN